MQPPSLGVTPHTSKKANTTVPALSVADRNHTSPSILKYGWLKVIKKTATHDEGNSERIF
jgi:hypothetical protein